MVFDLEEVIPKRPLADIFSVGFLTGSRMIGGATEESDWDIVVPITWRQEAEEIVYPWSYSKQESNYFAGVTYSIGLGKALRYSQHKINLIFVHVHEFKAWYLATKALENTLPLVGTTTKKERTGIFQTLMTQFRSILPELGLAKNYEDENSRLLPSLRDSSPALLEFCKTFEDCK